MAVPTLQLPASFTQLLDRHMLSLIHTHRQSLCSKHIVWESPESAIVATQGQGGSESDTGQGMFGGKGNSDYRGAPSVHRFPGMTLVRMWPRLSAQVNWTVVKFSQSIASSGKPLEVHLRGQVGLPGMALSKIYFIPYDLMLFYRIYFIHMYEL